MATWFVTGASRGFGREVALEALRTGDTVVATARSTRALTDLVELGGDRVLALELDVTKPEQVTAATQAALERFGRIDVLFNNAGIGYFAAVEESDEVEVRRMVEINLFGLASVTTALLPSMRQQRAGTVMNVSSVGGLRSFPAVGWYNATKFAVEGLSEALDLEASPLGIRVVLVEPSGFATDWAGQLRAGGLPGARDRRLRRHRRCATRRVPRRRRKRAGRPHAGREGDRSRRPLGEPTQAPAAGELRL